MDESVDPVIDGRYRRVEVMEGEQMNAPSALITHRQQRIAGELPLDAQRVFQAVRSGVDSVIRPVRVAQQRRSATNEGRRPVRIAVW